MAPILLLFLYVLSISSSSADISKATVTEGVVNEGATQECPSCDNVLEQERVKFESIMDKEREECTHKLSNIESSLAATSKTEMKALQEKLTSSESRYSTCTTELQKVEADLEHSAAKLTKKTTDLNAIIEEQIQKLADKEAEIKKLFAKQRDLNNDIADLRKEVDELTTSPKAQKGLEKYCNTTLIVTDAEVWYNTTRDSTLQRATEFHDLTTSKISSAVETLTFVTAEVRSQSSSIYSQTSTFIADSQELCQTYTTLILEQASETYTTLEPHIQTATTTASDLYVANLKPLVDEKIRPVYDEKLSPHVTTAAAAAADLHAEYSPKAIELYDLSIQTLKNVRLSAISLLSESCTSLKETLPDAKYLDTCVNESEWVVDCVIKFFGVLMFMRYGLGVIRLAWKVGVVWPFKMLTWPLWIFGGNKSIN
ncbi:hypothetical protein TrVE_jg4135 [Triparma verrucosa]|uniref:Uncharacterized protein n=2 Tax=Triparma TaxID=722752 RepID=A0A9W6ZWZ4_9STRA|nr:hypothetical protein TrST_g5260 [Triparma strigata]GMH90414.1 hypothetical protein TrVE_jg4135 [Triparma verrucosa]